jgi:hypothetical protein
MSRDICRRDMSGRYFKERYFDEYESRIEERSKRSKRRIEKNHVLPAR